MLPGQEFLSVTSASGVTAVTYCNDIKYQIISEPFELVEFSHSKLLQAPEDDGTDPTVVRMLFNKPLQITSSGSVTTTLRPLNPDTTNLDQIYKKFYIQRYTITGAETANSDMANLFYWSTLHKTLQDRFEAHQKFAQGNISYNQLLALQSETFSYLTTTGYSFNTPSLGTINNVLIRNLDVGLAYSVNTAQGLLVLNDYTLILDDIQILPASAS